MYYFLLNYYFILLSTASAAFTQAGVEVSSISSSNENAKDGF